MDFYMKISLSRIIRQDYWCKVGEDHGWILCVSQPIRMIRRIFNTLKLTRIITGIAMMIIQSGQWVMRHRWIFSVLVIWIGWRRKVLEEEMRSVIRMIYYMERLARLFSILPSVLVMMLGCLKIQECFWVSLSLLSEMKKGAMAVITMLLYFFVFT